MTHEPYCESYDITTITTSSDFHLHWKNDFHKNPLFFRVQADVEADIEIHISNIG